MGRMRIGKCEKCGMFCNLNEYEGLDLCYYCRLVRRFPEELPYLRYDIRDRVAENFDAEKWTGDAD